MKDTKLPFNFHGVPDVTLQECADQAVNYYFELLQAWGICTVEKASGHEYQAGWFDGFRTAEIYLHFHSQLTEAMKKQVESQVLSGDLETLVKIKARRALPQIIQEIAQRKLQKDGE